MDSGGGVWNFISKSEGAMKKGIVKHRIQFGTFSFISVGVKAVLSVLDLITAIKFDFFCSCFNEIKRTDVSKLICIRCVIYFVYYSSFKSTVSGPDGLLLTAPANTNEYFLLYAFAFSVSLCVLVQHGGVSCMECI